LLPRIRVAAIIHFGPQLRPGHFSVGDPRVHRPDHPVIVPWVRNVAPKDHQNGYDGLVAIVARCIPRRVVAPVPQLGHAAWSATYLPGFNNFPPAAL
jgi:hypothetical protein